MSISLLANGRDKEAVELAKETPSIVEESLNEYAKAAHELTLAYILMVSNLDEFRRNANTAKSIVGLISSAHNKFEKLRATSVIISLAIWRIGSYLLGHLDFDKLLEDLDGLISILEEEGSKIRA